jgi:2',3'-cyclic-nucleotide 2'-phosphodiesterase/3'-nucleotidase
MTATASWWRQAPIASSSSPIRGKPIDEKAEFIVVTNNYRASGGGNFPGTKTTVVLEAPDLNRDVIVRYIIEKKAIDPAADNNWSLKPLPATVNVTFPTSPAAVSKKPETLKAQPVGDAGEGFVKYRLGVKRLQSEAPLNGRFYAF